MKKRRGSIGMPTAPGPGVDAAAIGSKSLLEGVMDFLPDATFVIDMDKKVVVWNRAMEELSGVPAHEMIGKGGYEYALPFYGARQPMLIDLCMEPDDVIGRHHPVFQRTKDRLAADVYVPGTVRSGAYLWGIARPLYDRDGAMVGFLESIRDVTDRKRTEDKFATVFKLSPYILSISTLREGRYVEVSDRFYEVGGFTREEVIGHTAFEINLWVDPADRDRVLGMLGRTGSVINEEIRFRMKNGDIHCMLFSAEVISISGTPHLLAVDVDITEKKRAERERKLLEERLRQAQKMESVGRLAGGVAHDFNNLLTAILGNADLARMNLDDREETAAQLDTIQKAAASAAQLTRQLLAFSRNEIIEPSVIDVNELIERTNRMLARLIGEHIRLKTSLKATGRIKADQGQIEQIIMNITVNARDAMPDGGTLIIGTEDLFLDEDFCRTHDGHPPGDHVVITLSDTGHGMDEETKKSIFEPFFTTKGRGKGTGLGLAMVHGAVNQNGGMIEVYSAPGEGTAFKVFFPRTDEAGEAHCGRDGAGESPTGNETILLVEDDDLVRDYASRVLSGLGYRVIQKSNGEEAIAFGESSTEPVHLLLTDVVLTGMNGKALSLALTARRPEMKVLFSSGYTADLIAERGILPVEIHFIGKPYSSSSLARKVREVLDAG